MISVQEARDLIKQRCKPLAPVKLPLEEAGGYTLAETLHALIDQPHFDQSAMDGYAFSFEDWDGISPLTVIGEVQAGSYFEGSIAAHQAIRIFTGAAIPTGLDTVVIQEKVKKRDTNIIICDDRLKRGSNVRLRASQTKSGDLALEAKAKLTPAAVAFLAGFGYTQVAVYPLPKVAIINTGKELTPPGQTIGQGMIYESNSYSLRAGLQQCGINPISIDIADDDVASIASVIKEKLTLDLIILTGGVSVGDYDYVIAALQSCGVEQVFHKVRQKPGKPLYFGLYGDTLVFGLPGNPASVLSCFYEYIADALSILSYREFFPQDRLLLVAEYTKKAGLTYFMKGKITENAVCILDDQESYKLNSYARADCIITLDEEREFYDKGEFVLFRKI